MKIQENIRKLLENKNCKKYLVVLLISGIILMLLPVSETEDSVITEDTDYIFSIEREEQRLEKILSTIRGVSKCNVLLSVTTGTELILAEDDGKTVVLSKGNEEKTVTILERYPGYQGAVIVIGGYSDANVRFDVLSAVMSYTGLGTDKITICPIEE